VVEHELAKRAIQPRHLPAHEGEARARNRDAGFEIEAQRRADLAMILGVKIEGAGRAPAADFDIVILVRTLRHFVERQVGDRSEQRIKLAETARSCSSSCGSFSFNTPTSAFSASAVAVSPLPIAAPMAFEASLRRDCPSCSSVSTERRRSSSARISADTAAAPRRASAASKAAGFSRMDFRSCMAKAYAERRARAQAP
jgi:hypothetical protein